MSLLQIIPDIGTEAEDALRKFAPQPRLLIIILSVIVVALWLELRHIRRNRTNADNGNEKSRKSAMQWFRDATGKNKDPD